MGGVRAPGEFAGTERFDVLSRLGSGGMGVVYRALDRERDAVVALKVLTRLTADAILRFKNEFRSLQGLVHPNLARIGELHCSDGRWFFTLELIEGVDFLSWVRPAAPSTAEPRQLALGSTEEPARITESLGDGSGPIALPELPRPPHAPARRSGALSDEKLRTAFAQLIRGLAALHAAGKVHRDVKPSNVLVTNEPRVVLVDFGLVADAGQDGVLTGSGRVVGTAAYMAPEQAVGARAGPEADWYSAGVMLYEALTGRLPFEGRPADVILAKQQRAPTPPWELSPECPRDLAELAMKLLATERERRPGPEQLLAALSAGAPSAPSILITRGTPFIGREREMSLLSDAFDESRAGRALVVYVEGDSGLGKTVLVRHFVESVAAPAGAVVLAGRCYEREKVPYKAFDGVADALARHMMRLSAVEAAALLPRNAAYLGQAFPVLKRVEAIAQAPKPRREIDDPLELRNRVFAALRELLARIVERSPLVVAIDDLQWADADGLLLLDELLAPPEPPPLLLLATLRTSPRARETGAARLPRLPPESARTLEVGPLPLEDAASLALALFEGEAAASAEAIAHEAGGHPLFIDELVRHARATGGGARGPLRLDEALGARIDRLEPGARALLELVATAGAPTPQEVIARAASESDRPEDWAAFLRSSAVLRASSLVRTSGLGRSDRIEPYHDRIREAVLAHLTPEAAQRCHRRLAVALESTKDADAESLAGHWLDANDPVKAAHYAALAGEEAARALAFERAAALLRLALELGPPAPETRQALEVRLGEVLTNAGRGFEAAGVFLHAAAGAGPRLALELQGRAADQLLRSGHTDEGVATIRTVLAAIGVRMASTPNRALASLLVRRAHLALRGIAFRERPIDRIEPFELMRVDTLWSAASGLAMVDHVRGADFQTRHLLLALGTGDPYRISRALALESVLLASTRGSDDPRAVRLIQRATELAERIAHPHAIGFAIGAAGISAFLDGKWRRGGELSARSAEILRERCTGVTWEHDTAQLYATWAFAPLGEIRELARRVPIHVKEALERGDRFAATSMRLGYASWAWLAADEVDRARHEAAEARRQWSSEGFHIQHFLELTTRVWERIYSGAGADACAAMDAAWPRAAAAMLLRVRFVRELMTELRAMSRLALACTSEGSARAELVAAARRDARRIRRETVVQADAIAELIEGQAEALGGRIDEAAGRLERACRALEQVDMPLHAAAARRARGLLIGGDEGRSSIEAADLWMRGQSIVRPDRMAAALAPLAGGLA